MAKVQGVPVDDDGGEQVEAGDPVMLTLRRAVADFALTADAQGHFSAHDVPRLFEADLCTALHADVSIHSMMNSVRSIRPTRAARRQDRSGAIGGELAQDAARRDCPALMVAAQRNRSGQLETISASRALPPTSGRNSLGVAAGSNAYSRLDGRSRMRSTRRQPSIALIPNR
jgi:hypothetical protein